MELQVKDLIATLDTNQWIIDCQLKGLAHADTLRQLPFRGNCMNWVLGHWQSIEIKCFARLNSPH